MNAENDDQKVNESHQGCRLFRILYFAFLHTFIKLLLILNDSISLNRAQKLSDQLQPHLQNLEIFSPKFSNYTLIADSNRIVSLIYMTNYYA